MSQSPAPTSRATVYLKPADRTLLAQARTMAGQAWDARSYLSVDELPARTSADARLRVEAAARMHGVRAGELRPGALSIVLSGPADAVLAVCDACHDDLAAALGADGAVLTPDVLPSHVLPSHATHRGRADLASSGALRPHVLPSHVLPSHVLPSHGEALWAGAGLDSGLSAEELAELYDFPAGSGAGRQVGVVVLSGDPAAPPAPTTPLADVLRNLRPVTVEAVPGHHGSSPSVTDATVEEVLLDVQVLGALVPAAELVLYVAESTARGLVDAVWAAATDVRHDLSVLLICYGSPEDGVPQGGEPGTRWSAEALAQLDRALAAAALRGITVVTSCGDNGAADAPFSTRVRADVPAASPWVLSCGGTRIERFEREPGPGRAWLETVWNDGSGATGGGISRLFPRPPWQQGVGVPPSADWAAYAGRGVPDVAALADPATGVRIRDRNGDEVLVGGTSVAAPVWAALVARCGQHLGRPLGLLTPALYALAGTEAFTDIVVGDNGAYRATAGWDPCTGLGTPRGRAILHALTWS